MIKIFYGEDRRKLGEAVRRELGEGYEVVEGDRLVKGDLENIFFGMNLFETGKRRVLIRDLGENKEAFLELAERAEEFMRSETKVVMLEIKVDKRTVAMKKILKAGVEVEEFKAVTGEDDRAVFGIFDLALRDGAAAVREVEKIEEKQDAFMFFGLLVTQVLRKIESRPQGEKERRMLRELAEIDMKMKSTAVEPWMWIKVFLAKVKTI